MTRSSVTLWLLVGLVACGPRHHEAPASEQADDQDKPAQDEPSPEGEDDGDEFEFEFDDEPTPEGGEPEEVTAAKAKLQTRVIVGKQALEAKELELAQREAELQIAKSELDKRLDAIAALEKRLDERLGVGEIAQRRRAQRLGELSKLILNMTPQAAADMVGQMSSEDAQSLVLMMARQNERKASKLLAAMPGERAAELGQNYLDRDPKALVPTETETETTPEPAASEPEAAG